MVAAPQILRHRPARRRPDVFGLSRKAIHKGGTRHRPYIPHFGYEVLQALFVKSDIVFVMGLGEDFEVEFSGPPVVGSRISRTLADVRV